MSSNVASEVYNKYSVPIYNIIKEYDWEMRMPSSPTSKIVRIFINKEGVNRILKITGNLCPAYRDTEVIIPYYGKDIFHDIVHLDSTLYNGKVDPTHRQYSGITHESSMLVSK